MLSVMQKSFEPFTLKNISTVATSIHCIQLSRNEHPVSALVCRQDKRDWVASTAVDVNWSPYNSLMKIYFARLVQSKSCEKFQVLNRQNGN